MHKKTYLRSLIGTADDLIKLMKYIMKITTKINKDKVDVKELHDILFRLCTRIMSTSMRRLYDKYWEEESNTLFSNCFQKLCEVKNTYWRLHLKTKKGRYYN